MRPYRWWLLLGIALLVVAACAPEGGGRRRAAPERRVFPKDRKAADPRTTTPPRRKPGCTSTRGGRSLHEADRRHHRPSVLPRRRPTCLRAPKVTPTSSTSGRRRGTLPTTSRRRMLWPCFQFTEEVRDLVIEACTLAEMEVCGLSLRVNDLHRASGGPSPSMIWTIPSRSSIRRFPAGPRRAAGTWLPKTEPNTCCGPGLNSSIRRSATPAGLHRADRCAHDFDGYELDFTAWASASPWDRSGRHAHLLTEMMREARQRLDARGGEAGTSLHPGRPCRGLPGSGAGAGHGSRAVGP